MRLSGMGVSLATIGAFAALTFPAPRARAEVGRVVHAIQNGATDTSDSYAVGVCLPYQGRSGPDNCGGVCSGVLIAPNLVVTARHCVDQTPTTIDCSSATFGAATADASQFYITTDVSMTQLTTGWHQVSQITTPSGTDLCGNDLALLQLVDVIPSSEATPATPAVQYPVYNHKHYGTTETAIGYGESSPGVQDSSQTRRDKQGIAIQCVMNDPQPAEDCVTQDSGWSTAARPNEFVAGNGTCEGDSGSGAFDQTLYTAGKPTVLGILSRGSESDDGTTCELGVYTRMDSFRDLIVQAVTNAASAGNYSVPAWTAAVPDDGDYPDADAGATRTSDASVLPTNVATGAECSANSECSSGVCHASGASGSFICTTACSTASASVAACGSGMSCASDGFCETNTASASASRSGSDSGGGCAVAKGGPGRPVPWKQTTISGVALGFFFLSRRRPSRSGTPGKRS